MKTRNLIVCLLGCLMFIPAKAQWSSWNTTQAISGGLGILESMIESAERKKEMEIMARQKVEFEQSFQDAMTEAKAYEAAEDWEEALEKYEEAAKLNCKYGYTEQRTLSNKITSLYVKGEREDDGPSILHNAEVTLPDYSAYSYMRENPVYVNKKKINGLKILRVACSDTETRVEMEVEAYERNSGYYIKGTTYIKGNKGTKLTLGGIQNITMAPALTYVPWPYQKLRFALIFPALPAEATEFDMIMPSTSWQFKDIKCK